MVRVMDYVRVMVTVMVRFMVNVKALERVAMKIPILYIGGLNSDSQSWSRSWTWSRIWSRSWSGSWSSSWRGEIL